MSSTGARTGCASSSGAASHFLKALHTRLRHLRATQFPVSRRHRFSFIRRRDTSSKNHLMNFCTPADCFSFAHPYFIAFSAACFRYGVLTIVLYTSLPSLPLVSTTVSCSFPTEKPSCFAAADAGLLYWGKPYRNVTCFKLPSANNFKSSFAARGDFTRHDIWSLVCLTKA